MLPIRGDHATIKGVFDKWFTRSALTLQYLNTSKLKQEKQKVFWCFQGDQKGILGRKGFTCNEKICQDMADRHLLTRVTLTFKLTNITKLLPAYDQLWSTFSTCWPKLIRNLRAVAPYPKYCLFLVWSF